MAEYNFSIPIQTRYADFDMLGHLNNAIYVTYYELVRVQYFSAIGWTLKDESNVVAHIEVDFLLPIFPEDKLICCIKTISLGRKSFKMQYQLTSEDGLKCFSRAHSVQVCIERKSGKAINIPDHAREILSKYDAL
jgi:acyl-CoA thioester hydrolase